MVGSAGEREAKQALTRMHPPEGAPWLLLVPEISCHYRRIGASRVANTCKRSKALSPDRYDHPCADQRLVLPQRRRPHVLLELAQLRGGQHIDQRSASVPSAHVKGYTRCVPDRNPDHAGIRVGGIQRDLLKVGRQIVALAHARLPLSLLAIGLALLVLGGLVSGCVSLPRMLHCVHGVGGAQLEELVVELRAAPLRPHFAGCHLWAVLLLSSSRKTLSSPCRSRRRSPPAP
mmetsp:Transcript_36258/g.89216  ORF Transcript_36258/g.89216 Transcript_36258/m.89216 type:complete len:232 (+) Transcript_36258:887-1582(+)